MISPNMIYRQDLQKDDFIYDPSQADLVNKLDQLYHKLLTKKSFWQYFFLKKSSFIKGVYIWGGVGRGKTYLVDTFYHCLPFSQKIRLHYHRFMQRVHNDLKYFKGKKNPLYWVAKKFSQETKIMVLDEFFVNDIADAMILYRLLSALFAEGITLVMTSNIFPDGLYRDGLHRDRFLPAITLIKEYMDVVSLEGEHDYRLSDLEEKSPNRNIHDVFSSLTKGLTVTKNTILDIEGFAISAVKTAPRIGWFNFKELCEGPRSQNDYIALAKKFHTILLDNIPVLNADNEDVARRFVYLVDEFYDQNTRLMIFTDTDIDNIYQGCKLVFEYKRTISRLHEMQDGKMAIRIKIDKS